MSYKKSDSIKNIVIVGGGGAGQTAARTLSQKLDASKYQIILIDPRPYRVLLPATLRVVTADTDNLAEEAFVPYDRTILNNAGQFVQGKVVSISSHSEKAGTVTLESGETIEYAYLVLATGAIWRGPVNFPNQKSEVTAFINKVRADIKDHNDIVLVGAGAVGVEFSGEIKDIYPNKNVTIVQGGSLPFTDVYPLKFRKAMEKRILGRGIKLIYNEYIDEIPEGPITSLKTRGGKTIKADIVFDTRGPSPNTSVISSSLGASAVTERGLVKVTPTLQLPSHPNIYAAGDILDIKEEKQLAKAHTHAAIVAGNILASIAGQPLKPYKGSPEMILATLGKNGGAAYLGFLWGLVFGDWFARMAKSKTLMVPMLRKAVGY
ncbi:hypothetical protein HGRIS_008242 [Hohenbuehelia grisea]|uniref:FAD/NAD(P)-binding domain-containing protein n=1 Tax=Hohenbuehelia grisea TaxID=104357 RepID=A0ABR3J7D7_9AGAR